MRVRQNKRVRERERRGDGEKRRTERRGERREEETERRGREVETERRERKEETERRGGVRDKKDLASVVGVLQCCFEIQLNTKLVPLHKEHRRGIAPPPHRKYC